MQEIICFTNRKILYIYKIFQIIYTRARTHVYTYAGVPAIVYMYKYNDNDKENVLFMR